MSRPGSPVKSPPKRVVSQFESGPQVTPERHHGILANMAKRLARPRDPNQLAKLILDIATGQAENVKPVAPKAGQRKGGLKGGKARARTLSATKRSAIARKAARTRWRSS
jgi:hypothetical protein